MLYGCFFTVLVLFPLCFFIFRAVVLIPLELVALIVGDLASQDLAAGISSMAKLAGAISGLMAATYVSRPVLGIRK